MIIQEKNLIALLEAEIDPAFKARAEFIFRQVFKYRPKLILDIGCGRGFYSNALATLPYIREIIAIDVENENIVRAKSEAPNKKIKYQKADIFNWSSKKKFDLIICSEVLEHVENENKFLKIIFGLLGNKAKLLVTVPSANYPFCWDPLNYFLKLFNTHVNKNKWVLAGIWADHERLYHEEELNKLLKNFNLKKILTKNAVHFCWPFSHFMLYGLGKNLVLKFKINSFDRFSFKPKPFAKIIAYGFSFPNEILTNLFNFKRKKSVAIMGLWIK